MKINKTKQIIKVNSLSFTSIGMKKNFFYILIILIVIITALPFSINLTSKNLTQKNTALAADECTVVSAGWNPSGDQSDNFFKEGQTNADIVIKTTGCVNYPDIAFSVYEVDGLALDDPLTDSGLYEQKIIIPADNSTIKIMLGEEVCEAGPGFDCNLYFKIYKDGSVIYQSLNKPSGNLFYECEGVCLSNGRFIEILSQGSDDKPTVITPQTNQADTPKSDVYKLLAPIGGRTEAPENIGDYFNTIFLIVIGLCGVLAVIMIVIGGVQYMGDESVFGKTDAKERIKSAILGLLIALGSYALLNTINPDLLGKGGVKINSVSAGIDKIEYISSESFTQITGKKVLSPSEYDTMGRKVAKEVGIPFCAIRVILERESKGNPGAIGFDENVRSTAVPSRTAFVNSGKKYNGETFTSSNDLITKEGFINQSKNDVKNTPGLGVDWRFSKGLGLTQITLFPDGYFKAGYKTNPPSFSTKDTYPTLGGLTPKDLLDPEKNLKAGAEIWKDSWLKCNKDIYGSWAGYGGGPGNCNPNSDFLKKEATTRTEFYNGCPDADKQV